MSLERILIIGGEGAINPRVLMTLRAIAEVMFFSTALEMSRLNDVFDAASLLREPLSLKAVKAEAPYTSAAQNYASPAAYRMRQADLSARHFVAARSHSGAVRHQHRSRENRVAERRRNAASFKP